MRRQSSRSPFRHAATAAATLAAVVFGLALVGLAPPAGAAQKAYSTEELFQPLLGASLSQWLVGPIARLASETEIDTYLRLKTDDDARRFIEEFWTRRDPDPARPGNPVSELYETRAAEADKKFSEAAVAGRRTDRGTIHILYGAPESVEHEEFQDVSGPDVELWRYPKKAEAGIDGRRPEREYRFAKPDDLTRFYSSRDLADRRRDASEPPFTMRGGPPGDRVPGQGDPPPHPD